MDTTTKGWRVPMCIGAALLVLCCIGNGYDAYNNLEYGKAASWQIGALFAAAALAVSILSVAGSLDGCGWDLMTRGIWVVCIVLTVACAWLANTANQDKKAQAIEARREVYLDAKARKKAAERVLAAPEIQAETGSLKQLAELKSRAEETEREAVTAKDKVCEGDLTSRICNKAITAEAKAKTATQEATERVSRAEARDKAREDKRLAIADMMDGRGETNRLAASIASAIGTHHLMTEDDVEKLTEVWEERIDDALAALMILASLGFALLGGKGARLVNMAWETRAAEREGLRQELLRHQALYSTPRPVKLSRIATDIEPDLLQITGPEQQALEHLVNLLLQHNGTLAKSQRAIAEELGIPRATLNDMVARWHDQGRIIVDTSGRGTVFRLPN